MLRYAGARTVRSLLTVAGVAVLVFLASRLSGDPTALLLSPETPPEQRAVARAELGLDAPLTHQFARFVRDIARGDFGESFRFREPALDLIGQRLPESLALAGLAALVALPLGIWLGVVAAGRPRGLAARCVTTWAQAGQAVPGFAVATLLVLIFAVELGWFPTSGFDEPRALILPVLALAWYPAATMARMTRATMLEVAGAPFVQVARAKGLPERTVTWRHAFRNAWRPVIALASLQLIALVNGSIVIESVFAWPGIGQLTVQAVLARDYPVVQAAVILMSAFVVGINLFADLAGVLLDPRERRA